MKKLFGLGRGLESLIPTKAEKQSPKARDHVFYIEVNKIKPNSAQPRKGFEKEGLKELAASIKKYGILQPLLVSKVEIETEKGIDVEYELLAGERRWRAAKIAGMPHVPAIIKDNFDEKRLRLEVALVENLQRENLNPLEEAEAYARLTGEFSLTQKDIAGKVGKSREVIANSLRLLALPPDMKEALRSGRISRTHGRALLAYKNPAQRAEMFKKILGGNVATHDLETAVRDYNALRVAGDRKALALNARFKDLQENLSKNLSAVVWIRSGSNGGNIVIKFGNLEELNKIVKTILG